MMLIQSRPAVETSLASQAKRPSPPKPFAALPGGPGGIPRSVEIYNLCVLAVGWMCLEKVQWKMPGGGGWGVLVRRPNHLNWLLTTRWSKYSLFPLDVQTLYHIFKATPCLPTEESHFRLDTFWDASQNPQAWGHGSLPENGGLLSSGWDWVCAPGGGVGLSQGLVLRVRSWDIFLYLNCISSYLTNTIDNFYRTKEEEKGTQLNNSVRHKGMFFYNYYYFYLFPLRGSSSSHEPLLYTSTNHLKLPAPHLLHLYNREAAHCRVHLKWGPRLNNIN